MGTSNHLRRNDPLEMNTGYSLCWISYRNLSSGKREGRVGDKEVVGADLSQLGQEVD
jgi:hypothetical protein